MNEKPVVPSPGELDKPTDETRAVEEENAYKKRIDLEQLERKHWRHGLFYKALTYVGVGLIITIGFLAIATVVVVGWHYLVSESYHWLSEPQLDRLRDFLFSGAVIGFSVSLIRPYT